MEASRTRSRRPSARVVSLALACHLGPTLAVSGASAADAAISGRGVLGTVAVTAAVLAGQCSIGWQNDLVDERRDLASARRDKPLVSGAAPRRSVRTAFTVAAIAVVPLSLASGWRAALIHLTAVAAAYAYNLGLKATIASPLPYLVGFGLLPCFISLGLPSAPLPPWWIPLATALLGLGAHFANVLPDLDTDRRVGVLGLPQRVGRRASLAGIGVALGSAGVLLAAGPHLPGGGTMVGHSAGAGTPAVALGAVAVAAALACVVASARIVARRPLSRAPFGLVVTAALVDVVLLLTQSHLAY